MKIKLLILSLVIVHPLVASAAEACVSPPLVNDFIVQIENLTFDYQDAVGKEGIQCAVSGSRRDMLETTSTDTTGDTLAKGAFNDANRITDAVENTALTTGNQINGQIQNFISETQRPQDFLDSFLHFVPLIDRPYGLTSDLDRIQTRLDRFWELHMKANNFCQFDRAAKMRKDYAALYDTFRMIRRADQATYENAVNPYFIGYPAGTEEYTMYQTIGYYHHPKQLACSNEELNLVQVGAKLEKLYTSLEQAAKEIDEEANQQVSGLQRTWSELERQGAQLNKGFEDYITGLSTPPEKKTPEAVISDLQRKTNNPTISIDSFFEQYDTAQNQWSAELRIQTIQDEVRRIYGANGHATMRIQEEQLENMIRVLKDINTSLQETVDTQKDIEQNQATGIN